MNKYIKYSFLLIYIVIASCTDVIDVEVPVAAPRLVIEASLDWEKGTLGNEQIIKLSSSTPYFESNKVVAALGATVTVANDISGEIVDFIDQNNGNYTTTNFIPVVNQTYTLEIFYNGEKYTANETLMPVVDIDEVYQSTDQGFNKDDLEVNVLYTDPADIANYYLFKFQHIGDYLPVLYDFSDEFTDGNQVSFFYESEDFAVGDEVAINLYGISAQYFNYIRLLIEQSSEGGPFSTIPAQLKGNCINTTNSENYAFGYFRLTQVSKETYTFE